MFLSRLSACARARFATFWVRAQLLVRILCFIYDNRRRVVSTMTAHANWSAPTRDVNRAQHVSFAQRELCANYQPSHMSCQLASWMLISPTYVGYGCICLANLLMVFLTVMPSHANNVGNVRAIKEINSTIIHQISATSARLRHQHRHQHHHQHRRDGECPLWVYNQPAWLALRTLHTHTHIVVCI